MIVTHCEFCDEELLVPANRALTDLPVSCPAASCNEELAEIARVRGVPIHEVTPALSEKEG